MKNLLKGMLLIIALLLVGAIITTAVGWHYLRGMPSYYKAYKWTEEQRRALNRQTDNKLALAEDQALKAASREIKARNAGQTLATAHEPIKVVFSEEELNAVIRRPDVEDVFSKYVEDPGIYLNDGQIILAGKVKDYGYLISFYFEPKIDDQGKLKLSLIKTLGGRLSVPRSALSGKFDDLRALLEKHLPDWQRQAKMDSRTGGCNSGTIKSTMGKLALSIMADRPAEPLVFLPSMNGALPLRLTDVQVKDQELSLTLLPLTPEQRRQALDEVKKPVGERVEQPIRSADAGR